MHPDLVRIDPTTASRGGDAGSENRHREAGIHRVLNTDVAVVQEFPIKRWRIDVFSKGGSSGVLNEDADEFCGRLGEIVLDILLHVNDEH